MSAPETAPGQAPEVYYRWCQVNQPANWTAPRDLVEAMWTEKTAAEQEFWRSLDTAQERRALEAILREIEALDEPGPIADVIRFEAMRGLGEDIGNALGDDELCRALASTAAERNHYRIALERIADGSRNRDGMMRCASTALESAASGPADRPAPALPADPTADELAIASLTDERDGMRKALHAIRMGIAQPSPRAVAEDALNGRYFDPSRMAAVWDFVGAGAEPAPGSLRARVLAIAEGAALAAQLNGPGEVAEAQAKLAAELLAALEATEAS